MIDSNTNGSQNQLAPSREQPRKTDFLKLLWRGKWLILLGATIGPGLGYLYYLQQDPVYESAARVIVKRKDNSLQMMESMIPGESVYERMQTLATQSALIRSPLVVRRALDGVAQAEEDESLLALAAKIDNELSGGRPEASKPKKPLPQNRSLAEPPTLASAESPVGAILEGLDVQPAKGNAQILDLSYRCGNPQDCGVILNAIITSYQGYLRGSRDSKTKEAVKLIVDAKNKLEKDLQQNQEHYRLYRVKVGHLLFQNEEGENVHQQRQWEIEAERSLLLKEKSQIFAELETIKDALEKETDRRVVLASLIKLREETKDEEPTTLSDTMSAKGRLLPLLLEESRLTQDFGPDHPDVISIRQRITLSREVLGIPEGDDQKVWDPLDFYAASLHQKLAALEVQEKKLNDWFNEEQEESKKLEQIEADDARMRGDIDRKTRMYDELIARLEHVNLSEDLGGFEATAIVPPGFGMKVAPSLVRTLAVSIFLGMMCGFGLAYVVDLADKRFRSPVDVRDELGLPMVGHIPILPTANADPNSPLDRALCTFHDPLSPASEAFRAVRTSIYFSARASNHQVIQITSPAPGDGKTTLSTNLAVTIAQSNKRVLLLDADCRRPRVHKVFNVPRTVGLSSVIEGDTEPREAIVEGPIANLSLMTCGPRTNNPSELLTSPRFAELLDLLREQYDFVVIDAPPLLAVSDSCVIAPRADGVLLTLRMTKRARANSRRAAELLDDVDANVLGVVVNGVGHRQGYGTGGYAYASGYSYGSEESARYFAANDDDAEAAVSPENGSVRVKSEW